VGWTAFVQKDELDAFARRFLIPYIDMGMDVHETGPSKYLVQAKWSSQDRISRACAVWE
jgi:hypothetical protein